MEHKKEEAIKAIKSAEKKLENAQNKIYGSENDWYRILEIEQSANETTIRKQYKRLVLLLHPDKNNFDGAEAASKLVAEANCLLSDHSKRRLYDMNKANFETGPRNQQMQKRVRKEMKKLPIMQIGGRDKEPIEAMEIGRDNRNRLLLRRRFLLLLLSRCQSLLLLSRIHLSLLLSPTFLVLDQILHLLNSSIPLSQIESSIQYYW
ncbi:chaperone protein dnaJ 49-like [Momordica charantia]|uniref:Chaperone protein dnaJ 49-like n=1 Tax=Momordica charantia TaxID=3673 RepID=A0A6J1DMM5_MOMCH|nr:chaperone protein dnaJ 49-like [Momordica charantia]